MNSGKVGKAKTGRGAQMDKALFEALKTAVPEKNTGPDPYDILSDPAREARDTRETGEGNRAGRGHAAETTRHLVDLDRSDRARIEHIAGIVRENTGEQPDVAGVIRIALRACLQDRDIIKAACNELRPDPAHKKQETEK